MKTLVKMVTASGEEHGLINVLPNYVPFNDFANFKPEHKKELEAQKKEDSRMVEVEYLNSRGRNERLTKPYCKYAGDPIHIYHLIPGYTYTLPLGMVNEVNDKSKIMKKRAGLMSQDGKDIQKTGAPLEQDSEGDWIHKLVKAGFN